MTDSGAESAKLTHRRTMLKGLTAAIPTLGGCISGSAASSEITYTRTPLPGGWKLGLSPPVVTDELLAAYGPKWGDVLMNKDELLEPVGLEPGHVAVVFDLHLRHEAEDAEYPPVESWGMHEEKNSIEVVRHWEQLEAAQEATVIGVPGGDEPDIYASYGADSMDMALCYEVNEDAEDIALFHDPDLREAGMDRAACTWSFDVTTGRKGLLGWLA